MSHYRSECYYAACDPARGHHIGRCSRACVPDCPCQQPAVTGPAEEGDRG